jgi:hypothetical protein
MKLEEILFGWLMRQNVNVGAVTVGPFFLMIKIFPNSYPYRVINLNKEHVSFIWWMCVYYILIILWTQILVAPVERQWASSQPHDFLLIHPENQIDSFILYIKSTILICKLPPIFVGRIWPLYVDFLIAQVKSFNIRFRSRHFAGDAYYIGNKTSVNDPRESPAFMELDHIVSSFRASFPSHLRNPIVGNVIDNHLYTAFLTSLA